MGRKKQAQEPQTVPGVDRVGAIRDRIVELRRVPASELRPNPKNWRTHPEAQRAAMRGVLEEVGYAGALLARDTPDGLVLIDGHLRAEVGPLETVPVLVLDVNEAEADKILATYDPIAAMAEADAGKLEALLREVDTGSEAIGQMLEDLAEDNGLLEAVSTEEGPEAQLSRADELAAEWGTALGQLWKIGDHRLLCGDSTDRACVERVMAGERAALILADPPYFGKVDEEWDNDFAGYDGFLQFLGSVFALWAPIILDRGTAGWWCAPDYAWHIEGLLREHFAVFNHIVWSKGKSLGGTIPVDDMRRWRPRSERLLLCEKQHSPDALLASFNAKTSHIAARSAYTNIIDRMMAWQKQSGLTGGEIDRCLGKNGMAGHYFGRSQWALPTREAWEKLRPLFSTRGVDIGEFDAQRLEFDAQRREFGCADMDNLTDVWEMSAPIGDDRHGHPTPKPLALISKLVSAHSRSGDIVSDPFLGSGTCLIACEQLHRKCRAIEISPGYVAVALQRCKDAGMTPERQV